MVAKAGKSITASRTIRNEPISRRDGDEQEGQRQQGPERGEEGVADSGV